MTPLCRSCLKDFSHLGLKLHNLELLSELIELLVDVHHSHRGVRYLTGFGIHFLFTGTGTK